MCLSFHWGPEVCRAVPLLLPWAWIWWTFCFVWWTPPVHFGADINFLWGWDMFFAVTRRARYFMPLYGYIVIRLTTADLSVCKERCSLAISRAIDSHRLHRGFFNGRIVTWSWKGLIWMPLLMYVPNPEFVSQIWGKGRQVVTWLSGDTSLKVFFQHLYYNGKLFQTLCLPVYL